MLHEASGKTAEELWLETGALRAKLADIKHKEVVAWRVSYNWGETWTVFDHDPSLQLAGVPGVIIRPLVEGETE